VIGTPKSGKSREIPLNDKVLGALKRHRHLRGELVFLQTLAEAMRCQVTGGEEMAFEERIG
jgi:hypothetical protein